MTKLLLPLHASPLATGRFTKPLWTLWMFIFVGCFDLSFVPPAKQIGSTHGTLFYKICAGSWRFDVVGAKFTTIPAFVLPHFWFTSCSMGITNFGLESPEYWKNGAPFRGCGTPQQKPPAVGKVHVIGKQML